MDINDIYQFLLKIIRKNQSGDLNATAFGYFWNSEQSSYFDDLVGRFQAHNNSKEGVNIGLIQDETILTKLSPFITTKNIPVTNGVGARPSDFIFRLAIRVSGYKCIVANNDQVWSINDDVIDPPSTTDNRYYAIIYGSNYNFIPSSITNFDMDYVAAPIDVKWNFNIDAVTKRQVYTSNGSVQSQWDISSNREITKRVLKVLGVSYQDKDFENYGQSVISTGE
jgi:hypothetical protein